MKKSALSALLGTVFLILFAQPGFGVSKEIIQMMTEVDTLQQEVQNLQRTVDTQTAVIKTLIQQTNSNVDAMKKVIAKMQDAQGQSLASTGNRFDSMSGQIQQLSASMDEAKGEISKLSDQLAETQKILQTLNAQPPTSAPSASAQGDAPGAAADAGSADAGDQAAPPQAAAPVPDPQTLYKSAYADYEQGQYSLAIQGFEQYLQDYGDTDLASNAQFYVGDSYYLQRDYRTAIKEYDKCVQGYPDGNKAPAAMLKKGYALLALNQRTLGEHQLTLLLRMFPHSHEAALAQERLRRLRAAYGPPR